MWGLQGMRLERNATLVGMSILSASVTSAAAGKGAAVATPTVLLVTAQGLGKRLPAEVFKLQHRAGVGNIAIKCNAGDRLMALHVVRVCVCLCVFVCVRMCVHVCMCVFPFCTIFVMPFRSPTSLLHPLSLYAQLPGVASVSAACLLEPLVSLIGQKTR